MGDLGLNLAEGQLKITMKKAVANQFTLEDAGLEEAYTVEGGNLRVKVELGYIKDVNFYKMPKIEFDYTENIHESNWIVEFNGENILETKDHSGKATILLLNRKKMKELVNRHENNLLIHGNFSEEVAIKNTSSLQLLEIH
ncbi:hypothetical protein LPB136_05760 [Tenacibaculum todarodis]|uniref:Uncharacterized protein n=1 Tax=Tenacibaculum todarodis TaxID=1850252 RepID=A0A1L3JII1_9FLAO|nr:hypothetical protein [Tenacibaculum todarodis]APG64893.1 hypothetical protein LPB136_05760 [Tenacibaculum todarodis]